MAETKDIFLVAMGVCAIVLSVAAILSGFIYELYSLISSYVKHKPVLWVDWVIVSEPIVSYIYGCWFG